jgi:hypothetical protein
VVELHYKHGMVDDPYGVGQLQLRITEAGVVVARHLLGNKRKAWSGQVESGIFRRMSAALDQVGFPRSPGQAPPLVPGTQHYTFTRKHGEDVESLTLPDRSWPAYQNISALALRIIGHMLAGYLPGFKAEEPPLVVNVVENDAI